MHKYQVGDLFNSKIPDSTSGEVQITGCFGMKHYHIHVTMVDGFSWSSVTADEALDKYWILIAGPTFETRKIKFTRWNDLVTPPDLSNTPKCECGAASTGAKQNQPGHSTWCPWF